MKSSAKLPLPDEVDDSPSMILLLRWTNKAHQHPDLVAKVRKELERHQLIIVSPTPSAKHEQQKQEQQEQLFLLSATQESLERQAEWDHLVKRRRIIMDATSVQTIMDYFTVANRMEFWKVSASIPSHAEGMFSTYERAYLTYGLLERISVTDRDLLQTLSEHGESYHGSQNLRYLLQSHGWVDILTPVHVESEKHQVYQTTWYPLMKMRPPVDVIEAYYGPPIAFYFAFMGFLGIWLARLGILGLLVHMFRIYRRDTIDEDEYTPFYGLVCFLWAVLLQRFWERRELELAYRWGTLELQTAKVGHLRKEEYKYEGDLYSHRRPEFRGSQRTSPITRAKELYYSHNRRKLQYLVSAMITSCMLGLAFWIMTLSLNLQGYIRPNSILYVRSLAQLSEQGAWLDATSNWRCYIPVVLHSSGILTLNALYRQVAAILTEWENHETQTSHDHSLILKRFLFEAFDCYVVLFYLAFYERDVERLRIELVTVFNIDSFRRLAVEVILPYIIHAWTDPTTLKPTTTTTKTTNNPVHDHHLLEYEQFDDYMEIMIQFGYVTLFASAYPLASLVMAGAVWIEIRSDMYKLTHLCQKPLAAERIHTIGIWKSILQVIIWSSCLTNCLLFGFTSDQMMHYMPHLYIRDREGVTHMVHDKGWVTILIIFGLERVLIVVGLLLHAMISPMSETLTIQIQRRKYILATLHDHHHQHKKMN